MIPPFRVVTTAFNEEDFIEAFLTYYLGQGAERIIVFDHGSTDATVAIAQRAGPRVEVLSFTAAKAVYTLANDEERCHEMFQAALHRSDRPCWWLFPDVDELIRPGPDGSGRLDESLAEITGRDGVPCIGLHCLPSEPESPLFRASACELLAALDKVSPPRSIEPAHCEGEAWKVPIWFFAEDARQRFAGLRPSSGRHLLLGETSHLRYHAPAWMIRHYKVRSVSRFLARSEQLIARATPDEDYKEKMRTARDRVAGWMAGRCRLLRLARTLCDEEIAAACRSARAPGNYLESPFRPDRWRGR